MPSFHYQPRAAPRELLAEVAALGPGQPEGLRRAGVIDGPGPVPVAVALRERRPAATM